MAISSNPRPRYPAELVPTGDTGTVRIRVAVEKNGVADMKSVIVVASPHPAFTREVLKVLPGYRFIPAEVGGTLTGGCQVAPSGVEMCKPGRPGKKLRMDVEMDFVFVVPPT